MIYETGSDGGYIGALDTESEREDAGTGDVTLDVDNKYIIVELDSDWSASSRTDPDGVGRSLVITFADITAPNPDGLRLVPDANFAYSFSASSSARNGTLEQLDDPSVTVLITSILGNNSWEMLLLTKLPTRDPLSREVTIKPGTIYIGEK